MNRKLGRFGCSRRHQHLFRRKRDHLLRILIFCAAVCIGPMLVFHAVKYYTRLLETNRNNEIHL